MPKVAQYNVNINCKRCNAVFLKQVRTGNLCHNCRRKKRDECRNKNIYIKCCMCGIEKEANTSVYCKPCYKIKYKGKYVKRDKSKIDYSGLNDVVQRIRYKQSSYIFSLFDVNDIINIWYEVYPGRQDIYEMLSSGEQIQNMWFDLVKIQEKNNGKKRKDTY